MEPVNQDPSSQSSNPANQGPVIIGVDLGQRHDPTAIIVVEVIGRPPQDAPEAGHPASLVAHSLGHCVAQREAHYVVRTVRRLDLGTPYPAVAQRLSEIYRRLRADGRYPEIWVDATGVGKPVVDLLNAANLYVKEVYLNGSDQVVKGERGELRLGKCLLVSRLQVLLQAGRIHLPATPEAGLLVEELLNYEIRVSEDAHAQFGAFRVGVHDDLATALGLACWQEQSFGAKLALAGRPRDVIAEADRAPWRRDDF